MKNAILAVDIGAGSLKLLYGTRIKILAYEMIDTPKASMEDNRIVRLDVLHDLIASFIKKNRLKPKYISFSVYGKDIVIRHIEVPYMKEVNVKQTVEWEIGRNLPNAGANYYIDFEILNREEGKRENVYRILVVAVLKERIENYLKLAQMLNLEIKAIDISANCTARVFKELTIGKNAMKNLGIIDIGQSNTRMTIIEKGKLAMERQVPFGFDKLTNEVVNINPELLNREYDYIHNHYNFNNIESQINIRINRLLDDVFTSFQKVIQFYTTGKIEKDISQFYVIGVGSSINGIEEIIQYYLNGSKVMADDTVTFDEKVKLLEKTELKYFVNTLGLLLRED